VSKTVATAPRRSFLPFVLAGAGIAGGLAYGSFAARLSFGPPLVMLGLGGLALALAAQALYRVLDPLLHVGPDRVDAPQAPVHVRELERDKQAVLKAIREIELDYQMRKIAEVDYREMLQRYRTRAMRIIRELDAGDNYRALIEDELKARLAVMGSAPLVVASAPAASAPVASAPIAASAACRTCGTGNDTDALFCKKCGTKLGGA
jgi:ribosomal protein L40E